MNPTIVLLAAGMSTRYGRLKQLEAVGPGGEALLDYAVFDAHRAGFNRVVLIIREELEEAFREHISNRWPKEMEVVFHFQNPDDLPEGVGPITSRQKPWGTAHALWSARDLLQHPFAVLNADDFYGPSAYSQAFTLMGRDLRKDPGAPPGFGLVAYTLEETLSRHGGVSRGICEVDRSGWLGSVEEVLDVKRVGSAITGETVGGEGMILNGQEQTSTNFWVFTAEIFPLLEEGFRDFLKAQEEAFQEGGEAEFLIPSEINRLLSKGEARVWVLRTRDPFFGITRSQDWEWVAGGLRDLIEEGEYPQALWLGSDSQG
jgi:hypothetical protein